MNDAQLLRYSRHILLDEIGIEGQERLLHAHALVVGIGGLGSPAALYLAASGVGKLTLYDGDAADLTNLQRQIAHRTDSIGTNKAVSAERTIASLNPEITVIAHVGRLEGDALWIEVQCADVVLDCSDNFATRHAINRACVAHRKPLISGAAIRFDGQVAVFDLRDSDSACYECLFPEGGEAEETRCAVMGIFAPLVGIIGSVQAAEALKVLLHAGQSLNGRLVLVNALSMEWRAVTLRKDPRCRVCG
jgi:molybdopterin-synthase adenylyltransferase